MTFAEILTDTYRRCGYTNPPTSTEVINRLKANVNETQEEILSHPSLRSLLYGTLTFASVANQARYGIQAQMQVRSITDTANQQPLKVRDLAWYRARNPDPTVNTGTPEWYIPLGYVAVQQVPAATGTGLWAASTSAADTTQTVRIRTIRVGGYPNANGTLLTGTTRVALTGLTDHIDVTEFSLDTNAAGDVSLFDAASGGNTLATIPRAAAGSTTLTSRYWGFLLCLTPSSALTYTVDVEHVLPVLTDNGQEPLLPIRFHRMLAMGARMKEYEKTSDSRYGVAKQQFDDAMRDLLYQVTCPPGYTVVPGGGTRDNYGSNLGPGFPPGRW